MKFIEDRKALGIKEFIFWSDNCGRQNKNQVVFSMYMWISQRLDITIPHKYIEKGEKVHAK